MNEALRDIINDSTNIVFFGGAGVSTESGIPDFRSENGLYKAKMEYGYSPETMLSADFFERHTDIFYDYYKKNLIALEAKPNSAHYALARLEGLGKLSAVVTQNIDGLHQMAGSEYVYELHGSVHRNRCRWCGKFHDLSYVLNDANCKDGIPFCECGGVVKPEVVLYGEMLDEECMRGAAMAISKADTLIVGGTSLAVYPAAGFVGYFKGKHLVVINMSATGLDDEAELVIREPIGKVLGDVVLL